MEIPNYLDEAFERHNEEGMLRSIVIKTPSGQFWNNLSKTQQDEWKEIIKCLRANPEDYLAHMRIMNPEVPIGG